MLQKHAFIINCARGGVVVEEDLLTALDEGSLAAAAIDVVAIEPPPPNGTGAKLHKHPKVISTPHLGGSTTEALARIATNSPKTSPACCSVRPAWAPSTHRSPTVRKRSACCRSSTSPIAWPLLSAIRQRRCARLVCDATAR